MAWQRGLSDVMPVALRCSATRPLGHRQSHANDGEHCRNAGLSLRVSVTWRSRSTWKLMCAARRQKKTAIQSSARTAWQRRNYTFGRHGCWCQQSRLRLCLASTFPLQDVFVRSLVNLRAAARRHRGSSRRIPSQSDNDPSQRRRERCARRTARRRRNVQESAFDPVILTKWHDNRPEMPHKSASSVLRVILACARGRKSGYPSPW